MSFDLWLYKSKPGAGPISDWSKACYATLGNWDSLKEQISSSLGGHIDEKSSDVILVQSIIQPGSYEVHANFSVDGQVEWLYLRGATTDDAEFLGTKLNISVFNPQNGQDLLIKS